MKWNLTDIFKNRDEFNKTKEEFLEFLDKIESYKGKIADSSENLYKCYFNIENALMKFEKLYSYGMFTYHLNMAEQEGLKLFKEVENLSTLYGKKIAFLVPEITSSDENVIKKYLSEDKNLEPYKRDILDILDEKKHTLSKESEELLANYNNILSCSENTFDILTNAEFKFGNIIDENGNNVELTDSNYSIYLKNRNQEVRKQAFKAMYKKYSEYINTITELYTTNVKEYAITSKIRKYSSSMERAVKHDDSSLKVYDALINAVNNNIEKNYEFLDLKKKLLKTDKMIYM